MYRLTKTISRTSALLAAALILTTAASANLPDAHSYLTLDSVLTTIPLTAPITALVAPSAVVAVPTLAPACTRLYTQQQFRGLAERAYWIGEPSRTERSRLGLIAHCQHGQAAERNVLHFEGHLIHSTNCSNSNVLACIRNASRRWRVDTGLMERRAMCESTDEPHNQYAGHDGLYQFLPSTFAETIYRHHDIWSAKWNSLAAAEMQSEGQGSQWECTGG